MFCRNCGTDVTDMKYCPKCGTPTAIENENVATGEKLKGSKVKRIYVLAMFGVGIALLGIAVTVLLSKSSSETIGNTAVPTMSITEESPQVTEETTDEEDITHNWWKDKAFQSTDSGLYFWIEEISDVWTEEELEKLIADGLANGNELWFMVGPEYLNDQNCLVVGAVDKSEISVGTDEAEGYIQYRFQDDIAYSDNTILICTTAVDYFYYEDKVLLLSKNVLNDTWLNESDTYYAVDPVEQPDETYEEQQPEEVYEESTEVTDFSLSSEPIYYECFETSGGWDSEIAIYYSLTDEAIDVNIIRIAGGHLELENGDQNPIVYSGYWEDFDSQVSITIPDDSPEITFTATGELEQYNGTYIQISDSGTDVET